MTVNSRREPIDDLALTRSQLMIWTGQRLQPSDPLYNMVLAFRIHGQIDAACFKRAFQALVDNSDALRTTFIYRDGIPRQRVHSSFRYDIQHLFMNRAELDAWIRDHAEREFDLERCLFESTLIELADNDFVVLQSAPPYDGRMVYSTGVRLYGGVLRARPGGQTGRRFRAAVFSQLR